MASSKKAFIIRPEAWLRDLIMSDARLKYRDYSEQIVLILKQHYAEKKQEASIFEGEQSGAKPSEVPVLGSPLPGQERPAKDRSVDRPSKTRQA